MLKKEFVNHPKLLMFMDATGVHKSTAIGAIWLLFEWASNYAPHGDVGRYPNHAIARVMTWEGDPDALVKALVESRLLDESDDEHRLVIHDWHDHCCDFVKKKVARSKKDFASFVGKRRETAGNGGTREETAGNGGKRCIRVGKGRVGKGRVGEGGDVRVGAHATGDGAPCPPPQGSASALSPQGAEQDQIEYLANLIEAHKQCRNRGSQTRRNSIADRIASDGLEHVQTVIGWVCETSPFLPERDKIRRDLLRFEDGLLPSPKGFDRLEQAASLMLESNRNSQEDERRAKAISENDEGMAQCGAADVAEQLEMLIPRNAPPPVWLLDWIDVFRNVIGKLREGGNGEAIQHISPFAYAIRALIGDKQAEKIKAKPELFDYHLASEAFAKYLGERGESYAGKVAESLK